MWLQGQQTGRVAVAPDQDDQSGAGRAAVAGDRGGDVVDGERGLCGGSGAAGAGSGGVAGAAYRTAAGDGTAGSTRGQLLPARPPGADRGALWGTGTPPRAVDPGTLAEKS